MTTTHIHVSLQRNCDTDPECKPAEDYCCTCTANTNYHNDPADGDSYIFMAPASCPSDSLRDKFVAAHEYGHAYVYQVAGVEYQVPASTTLDVDSDCYDDSDAEQHQTYKNHTIEWSSLAFREGWAHFVSARVWNNKADDGLFQWGSDSFDLERFHTSDIPEGTDPGGHLENVCCVSLSGSACATETAGAGVIPDWMRGFWDLHSGFEGETCTYPSRAGMVDLADEVLNFTGMENDGFYSYTALAVWLQTDCVNEWGAIAEHNGLDN